MKRKDNNDLGSIYLPLQIKKRTGAVVTELWCELRQTHGFITAAIVHSSQSLGTSGPQNNGAPPVAVFRRVSSAPEITLELQRETCACVPSRFSRVWLFVTPWAVAHQLLCPSDVPGKNAGVGHHALLQGIFPTQRSNPYLLHLLHWQASSLALEYLGSPVGI